MKLNMLVAALVFAAGSASAAPIKNVDFTNGLSGWTVTNNVVAGNDSATLTAGAVNQWASLAQTFTMNVGDKFTGKAQFFGKDYLPFNDYSLITMNGVTLFSQDIASVGTNGTSALTLFSYTALANGNYNFWAGVANQGDGVNSSRLVVSDMALVAKVPEPATLVLLGLGLASLALARRKA